MNDKGCQEIKDYLFDTFDWEIVHDYMKNKDWKWYNGETSEIPSIYQMMKIVEDLMESVCKRDASYASTGGFSIDVTKDKNGKIKLAYLSFSIEETVWEKEEN